MKDILIFGHNYLGDVLTMTPAIRALKLKFPESRIVAVVSKNASPILRRNKDIDKIVETERFNGIKGIARIFKLFLTLKNISKTNGYKFYICINFLASLKFSILGFMLSEKQVGREKFLNNFFLHDRIKFQGITNNIDKSLKLIEPFYINAGNKYFNKNYIYDIEEQDIKNAENILKNSFNGYGTEINAENFKFVLFSPGSTRKSKEAPPFLFSVFADFLNKEGYFVVITGNKKNADISKEIYDKIDNKHMSVNLTGLTDIYALGGLIYLSKLAVSVDNGTMHLASALKVPTIALFGSTDPAVCAPISDKIFIIDKKIGCYHCFKNLCGKEDYKIKKYPDCMNNILYEDIVEGYNFLLNSY